jgi:hypothetical protein
MLNHRSRQLLEIRIIPDITQFSWPKDPFQDPRQIHIEQRLTFALIKHQDGVADILPNSRQLLYLVALFWITSALRYHDLRERTN